MAWGGMIDLTCLRLVKLASQDSLQLNELNKIDVVGEIFGLVKGV